ncbi:hypothetical protein IFR05_007682 [Cadophora sp. M221]|nr:hypothetical protein IFR05_007682 [Cadophora sp. M221]
MCTEILITWTCGCTVITVEPCESKSNCQTHNTDFICDEPWSSEIEMKVECIHCISFSDFDAARDEDRHETYTVVEDILNGEIPLYIDQVGMAQTANDTRPENATAKLTLYEEFAQKVARNRIAESRIDSEYVQVDGKGTNGKKTISGNSKAEGKNENDALVKVQSVTTHGNTEADTEDDQFVDASEQWDE